MFRSAVPAVILTALVAAAATAPSERQVATVTASAAASPPMVQLSGGRFFPGNDGKALAALPQLMTWSGSTATVVFEQSSSVSVFLDARPSSLPLPSKRLEPAGLDVTIQFTLNGRDQGTRRLSPGSLVAEWNVTRLGAGRHTLTITKLTEAKFGAVWLQSIKLPPSGRFLAPSPLSDRRILFIGDSLTTGIGNLGDKTCTGSFASSQNTSKAFGPIAARALGADYQVVAWAGASISLSSRDQKYSKEFIAVYRPKVASFWRRADALRLGSKFRLSSWVPQLVVLAAGTNDARKVELQPSLSLRTSSKDEQPQQQFLADYVALVKDIREAYPSAAIVTLAWPPKPQLAGLLTPETNVVYQRYMTGTAAALRKAGVNKTFLLRLDGTNMRSNNYCREHADAATHAQAAEQLVRFIRRALPCFAAGPV